ncbi:hypothetical protein EJB05_13132, partial [Eragrostis curvula]
KLPVVTQTHSHRQRSTMSGLQTASAIAQVAGMDAFSLITLIVRAANTASQNKKTCRQLAKQVEQIRELLQSLENQPGIAITQRPETKAPLLELHETLQRARMLVESCQKGGYARQLCAGGTRAASLRDVQGRIDSFLRLFPIISHLDSTRLLVQVINSAAVRDTSSNGGTDEDTVWSHNNNTYTHDDHRLQNFSFSQLMTATDSFSFENQIEQGPLAILYKGHLCGNDVTLRKLSLSNSGQQLPQMQMKGGLKVEWPIRFRIIEGVAQGAIYLHNHSRQRIIHRDLKPSNVLLDSDMNPRISNFDLAKIVIEDSDQGTADCVVGSLGFIAPEYMEKGTFSVKTDVYSFGVMILETISGKRWTKQLQETYYKDLRIWAFKKTPWRGVKLEQRLKGFIHPSLHNVSFVGRIVPRCLSFPARRSILSQQKEVRRCIRVALLCIQQNPEQRPDMLEAARMLRPRKARVPFPRRPGYARESPMYAGDRS